MFGENLEFTDFFLEMMENCSVYGKEIKYSFFSFSFFRFSRHIEHFSRS